MAINMYKVTVGSNTWHYTSGEFDVTTGLDDYLAMPLKRTDLSFDLKETEVTLTAPSDLEPFSLFKYVTPLLPFTVEIIGYPSLNTVFKGNVLMVSFDVIKNEAKIKIGSAKALENTTCPARTFGTTCSYELYSEECGKNIADYTTTINVGSLVISGREMTHTALGAHGDNYYKGGYIEASTGETQYIVSQIGDTITLLGGIVTISEATTVSFYPGCNKSHVTCDTKFNNQTRFGGFPFVPFINIFMEPF